MRTWNGQLAQEECCRAFLLPTSEIVLKPYIFSLLQRNQEMGCSSPTPSLIIWVGVSASPSQVTKITSKNNWSTKARRTKGKDEQPESKGCLKPVQGWAGSCKADIPKWLLGSSVLDLDSITLFSLNHQRRKSCATYQALTYIRSKYCLLMAGQSSSKSIGISSLSLRLSQPQVPMQGGPNAGKVLYGKLEEQDASGGPRLCLLVIVWVGSLD